MEYSIIGGQLKIHKSVFAQEMLVNGSWLRTLLNWKTAGGFTDREHPFISAPDDDNMVTVVFDRMNVAVDQHPRDIMQELKTRYKNRIIGKIACRSIYKTFGNMFDFGLDLNSENDEIRYI
jgi:hypothetical protein